MLSTLPAHMRSRGHACNDYTCKGFRICMFCVSYDRTCLTIGIGVRRPEASRVRSPFGMLAVALIIGHSAWVLVPHAHKREQARPPPPPPRPTQTTHSRSAASNRSHVVGSLFDCGAAGRRPMVVIDTYLPYDTGGPEALVQVGEALLCCCGTTLIEGSIRIRPICLNAQC